jgi:hypothetical protein
MGNPNDDALARLQADWPNWEMWTRDTLWCARRRDDRNRVLTERSAADLAEALECEAGPRKGELVFADLGGWISGPTASGPVRAEEVRAGDVLIYDGRQLLVTSDPLPARYYESGEHRSGIEIATSDGDTRRYLYREHGELLHRLAPGACERCPRCQHDWRECRCTLTEIGESGTGGAS